MDSSASGPPDSRPPAGAPLASPNDASGRSGWRARFDLSSDQADPRVIDEHIRAGVAFRGTNVWLLIFAIFIASIGLNVNSTAVIIGAMLISPLMGPIMGAGYGAAVADFRLARRSTWNLAIAAGISLATSTLYFLATPLAEAHSELLARTSPSIWDVLIALFGGLAGIVGATRREKSNVVPGVAIATALMPPLCTAGYGLASGELAYFVGAIYLFFINSVFIAVATFVMVRVMRLPEVRHLDAEASRRAHRWIAALVTATALPSLWLAHGLVRKEVFSTRGASFVADAFPSDGATFVVARTFDPEARRIHVTVVGEPVSKERVDTLRGMLGAYGLDDTTLAVTQNETQRLDVAALQRDLTQDLYKATLAQLDARGRTIEELEAQIEAQNEARDAADAARAELVGLVAEIRAQLPEVGEIVVAPTPKDDALVVLVERARSLPDADRAKLRDWLGVRTGAPRVWVVDVAPDEVPPVPPPPAPAPEATAGAAPTATPAPVGGPAGTPAASPRP